MVWFIHYHLKEVYSYSPFFYDLTDTFLKKIIGTTRDVHAALHTWTWRSYTEAEVTFKTMLETLRSLLNNSSRETSSDLSAGLYIWALAENCIL